MRPARINRPDRRRDILGLHALKEMLARADLTLPRITLAESLLHCDLPSP
jgi:hypothetical protein